MSPQREISLMGQAIRPMLTRPDAEVRQCKSIGAAIGLAMTRGGFDQGGLAERVNCSRGYINLILSGKRPCTERMARQIAQVCGDAAPLQWICMKAGAELYVDPKRAAAALLRAQADEIERAA